MARAPITSEATNIGTRRPVTSTTRPENKLVPKALICMAETNRPAWV